ncbi:hypothetical protein KAT89_01935 [candidate division WOR-3 bacterium]|nr:hypothetical protein [candidate division WOR-3 bacterium]
MSVTVFEYKIKSYKDEIIKMDSELEVLMKDFSNIKVTHQLIYPFTHLLFTL